MNVYLFKTYLCFDRAEFGAAYSNFERQNVFMSSDKTGMFTEVFLKHSVSIIGCGSYWLNAGPFLSFHIGTFFICRR
jgi:hypothetical protein